jgi:nucleoid-associated protein Lsr2
MAQKVVVELIDDLDGGKAEETVTFGLDGRSFNIDLSGRNAKALRKALAPFVGSARKLGTARQSRGSARKTTVRSGPSTQEVRDWARSQGMQIADRGRIPADVTAQFQAAHGS